MYIADLHIHSKYSRATSRDLDLPHLDLWARRKGIALVATGDFTHPAWREEMENALEPAEEGLYTLKPDLRLPCEVQGEAPRFVISGEISSIYKKNGKTRKVHSVILLPDLASAQALSQRLEAIGNIHSDGRPILGLDCRDLLEIALDACPSAVFIPAHIWTPHFSLLGAFSGFDSLEECFGDLSGEIHAVETGLSSDPPMNWRVPDLDGLTLVSNSDAHSPAKLGREANLLDCALSYPAMAHAIQTGEGFCGTLEFYPEEGKYHLDGHRNCGVCLEPSEARKLGDVCPVCGRRLTIGVLHRVEALALRPEGARPEGAKPFESLVPLPELLSASLGAGAASRRVQEAYFSLLRALGDEMYILREADPMDIERVAGFAAAEGVRRLRAGRVRRKGGFDGEYGEISLFEPGELAMLEGQMALPGLSPVDAAREQRARERAKKEQKVAEGSLDARETEAAQGEAHTPQGLNEAQRQAVETAAPHVAVIAGPGTGKTFTLVERIAYLVEVRGAKSAEITAVTFTRQAAEEMRARLEARLGGKKAVRGMNIGTFHAICLALLEKKPLLGESEARDVARGVLEAGGSKGLSPRALVERVSQVKNGASLESAGLPEDLYRAYQARLTTLDRVFGRCAVGSAGNGSRGQARVHACAGGRIPGYQRRAAQAGAPFRGGGQDAVRHWRPRSIDLWLSRRGRGLLRRVGARLAGFAGDPPAGKLPFHAADFGGGAPVHFRQPWRATRTSRRAPGWRGGARVARAGRVLRGRVHRQGNWPHDGRHGHARRAWRRRARNRARVFGNRGFVPHTPPIGNH